MRDTRNLQFRLVLTRYFHIKTITRNVESQPLLTITQPLSLRTQNNVCVMYLLIVDIIKFVVAVVVVVVRVLAEYFV